MKEIIRAAFVIARRDFTAIIYSKAFIFFLLGPFVPVLVGFAAGNLGGQIAKDVSQPVVGIALAKEDAGKILSARESLSKTLGDRYFARMIVVGDPAADQKAPQSYLTKTTDNLSVVVPGTLAEPVITGTANAVKRERADIELLAGYAQSGGTMTLPRSAPDIVVGQQRQKAAHRDCAGWAVFHFLPDNFACGDGAVQSGGGEIEQDHRNSRRLHSHGIAISGQAIRDARDGLAGHIGLDNRWTDWFRCNRTGFAKFPNAGGWLAHVHWPVLHLFHHDLFDARRAFSWNRRNGGHGA